MSNKLALQSVRIHNFKAIQASGKIELTPLTVLIGNNGSGKSSLIEALKTYQWIIAEDLNNAMQRWRGFDYVLNHAALHQMRMPHTLTPTVQASTKRGVVSRVRQHEQQTQPYLSNPIEFHLHGRSEQGRFAAALTVTLCFS